MRATVAKLQNVICVFSQLSAASNLHIHGFDDKKIDTHVGYCNQLLSAAKVHLEAASMKSSKYHRDKNLLARLHWLRKPCERLKSKGNFRWKGENLRKCVISVFKFQP